MKILVVDDEKLLVKGIKFNLENDGYEVVTGCDGMPVDLTAKEFDLMELLMRNPNRVYSRETLLDAIWGYDVSSEIRTVDVHIRRLREKLELNPAQPEHILTKWGVGYYFKY